MQQLREMGYIDKKQGYYYLHREALVNYRTQLVQ
jgi:hypothetical protein